MNAYNTVKLWQSIVLYFKLSWIKSNNNDDDNLYVLYFKLNRNQNQNHYILSDPQCKMTVIGIAAVILCLGGMWNAYLKQGN